MEGSGNNWAHAAWEFATWATTSLCAAAAGAVLVWLRRLKGHVQMLRRHEELLNDRVVPSLGSLESFQTLVAKHPHGEELSATLEKSDAKMEKIHARINERKEKHNELDRRLAVVETTIKTEFRHISESLARIESWIDAKNK